MRGVCVWTGLWPGSGAWGLGSWVWGLGSAVCCRTSGLRSGVWVLDPGVGVRNMRYGCVVFTKGMAFGPSPRTPLGNPGTKNKISKILKRTWREAGGKLSPISNIVAAILWTRSSLAADNAMRLVSPVNWLLGYKSCYEQHGGSRTAASELTQ